MHFNWFLGVDGYKVGHPPLGPKTYTQAEYLEIAKVIPEGDCGQGVVCCTVPEKTALCQSERAAGHTERG